MEALVSLTATQNGKTFSPGKIIEKDGRRVFYRKTPFSVSVFHRTGEWSIDTRVDHVLKEYDVQALHFDDGRKVWEISYPNFKALRKVRDNGAGQQFYVRLNDFTISESYKAPWTKNERSI